MLCTRRSGGTAHHGWGCDHSIGSTVSDAIIRSWLWSTATRSPLGFFSRIQLIVDPTFCYSRFSIGRLLAIEDFLHQYYNIVILLQHSVSTTVVLHQYYISFTTTEWRQYYMKFVQQLPTFFFCLSLLSDLSLNQQSTNKRDYFILKIK